MAAVGAALAALLVAPAVWAVDTLGYATSGTFPAGGPASVQSAGGRWLRRIRRWRARRRAASAGGAGGAGGVPVRRRRSPGRRAPCRALAAAPAAQALHAAARASPAQRGRLGFGGRSRRSGGVAGRRSRQRRLDQQGDRLRRSSTAAARSRSRASRAPPGDHRCRTPTWLGSAASPGARATSASPGSRRRCALGKIRWVLDEQAQGLPGGRCGACRAIRAPDRRRRWPPWRRSCTAGDARARARVAARALRLCMTVRAAPLPR
jgi:hypothetical protein